MLPSVPLRMPALSRWLLRACCNLAHCGAHAQPVPPPAVLDPRRRHGVARRRNALARPLADVTVIDADEIARGGAQSVVELLQRQPGVEIVQNGGPGAHGGRVPARRERRADARADRRPARRFGVEPAPRRWRRFRSTRSSASRSCAVRRRACTAPMRSAASSRSSRGAATPACTPMRRSAAARYDTVGGSRGRLRRLRCGARQRCRSAARRSDGFNAIVNPANFSYDPDRDGYRNASVSANGRFTVSRTTRCQVQYFRSRLDAQFDGGDAFDDRTITTVDRVASGARRSFHPELAFAC